MRDAHIDGLYDPDPEHGRCQDCGLEEHPGHCDDYRDELDEFGRP